MFPIKTTERVNSWPVMTWLIMAANVYVFVQILRVPEAQQKEFFNTWGLIPAHYDIAHFQSIQWNQQNILPIFTSMFLHSGLMHILGNMLSLLVFGPNVEDRFGKIGFLIIYAACGLAAAVTQVVFSQTGEGALMPIVGASGAIAGVMGAFFVMFPKAKVVSVVPILFYPLIVRIPAWVYLVFWMGMNVISALKELRLIEKSSEGVAWWAHIGGFAIGMIYAALLGLRKKPVKEDSGETLA